MNMQWDKGPAELGTAPGNWAFSRMETVNLTTVIIMYKGCLRAWDQEHLRFPGFEEIINTDMDRTGIFKNKKMMKRGWEAKTSLPSE